MRRRHAVFALAAALLPALGGWPAIAMEGGEGGTNPAGGGREKPKKKEGEKPKEKKEKEKAGPPPSPGKGLRYIKIPTVALELYDRLGNFHLSSVDMMLLATEDTKLADKAFSDKLRKALSATPYEEYMKINPAPLIKSITLDLVHKEPGGAGVKEALIAKMLFR